MVTTPNPAVRLYVYSVNYMILTLIYMVWFLRNIYWQFIPGIVYFRMKGNRQVSRTISNRGKVKELCILIMTFILLFCVGCVPTWTPSDKEAAKLVREHYLFYDNGESVQATIVKRGEIIGECDCYPIIFKIVSSSGRKNNKTFYFYKNESGNVEVNEFMKRMKMVPI